MLKRAAALLAERTRRDRGARSSREGGKTEAEARGELGRAVETLAWNGEEAGRIEGRVIAGRAPGSRRLSLPTPVGVVAAFTAWNFPAVLATRKLGAILAAGCTAVLKAAEATPATAAEVVRALADAGAPPGVVNLVFGDPAAVSEQLIGAPAVRAVTFTGSTAVGRIVAGHAARGPKRTVLELGGHAPVIVDADADVELAVAATLPAKFGSAGQSCVAPGRYYVHEAQADAFTERFTAAVAALRPGADVGPVIDAGRVAALERMTADALARGARLLCGGERVDRPGLLLRPDRARRRARRRGAHARGAVRADRGDQPLRRPGRRDRARERDRVRVRRLRVHRLAAHRASACSPSCARRTSASTRWPRRCPTRRSAACGPAASATRAAATASRRSSTCGSSARRHAPVGVRPPTTGSESHAQQDLQGSTGRVRGRAHRAGQRAGEAERSLEGVQPDAQQGALHRPHAHHHARPAGVEGLRAGEVPADGQPAHRPAVHLRRRTGSRRPRTQLSTDQFGTQFDPPAHWAPEQAAIDEVPASYSVRPLVVINTVPQVAKDPKDFLTVPEVKQWERRHGRIPAGSVVMVRSDWSKRWTTDPVKAKELAADGNFPSVALDTLKFLHRKRHILFHGHEPLDTDSTPTLEGEYWLMHNGYAQAEGVDNLDGVPATGCLVSFGSPKFAGGLGGYARYIAICPPRTAQGRADLARRRAAAGVRQPAALGPGARLPRALSLRAEGAHPRPLRGGARSPRAGATPRLPAGLIPARGRQGAMELRPATHDEFEDFSRTTLRAFHRELTDDDRARYPRIDEPERSLAWFDDGRIVATTGAFTRVLTVPGGTVPCAAVTAVGVLPTHRRRGLLTAMMRRQLDDVRGRGEPVAALWASEGTIYGRFGYGARDAAGDPARGAPGRAHRGGARGAAAGRPRGRASRRDAPRLRARPGAAAGDARPARPVVGRPAPRPGGRPRRRAAAAGRRVRGRVRALRHAAPVGGRAAGRRGPGARGRRGHAGGARAAVGVPARPGPHALGRVGASRRADEPLWLALADPRAVRMAVADALWVRLVDVGAALSARSYAHDPGAVLEVADAFCPWNEGRWRLAGGACERTDAAADLELDAGALGSAYLGGVTLHELAAAGRVAERSPGALARVSAAFRGDVAPWCPEEF